MHVQKLHAPKPGGPDAVRGHKPPVATSRGPLGKAMSVKAQMYGSGESSDGAIEPARQPNEGLGKAVGQGEPATHRTQCRTNGSPMAGSGARNDIVSLP